MTIDATKPIIMVIRNSEVFDPNNVVPVGSVDTVEEAWDLVHKMGYTGYLASELHNSDVNFDLFRGPEDKFHWTTRDFGLIIGGVVRPLDPLPEDFEPKWLASMLDKQREIPVSTEVEHDEEQAKANEEAEREIIALADKVEAENDRHVESITLDEWLARAKAKNLSADVVAYLEQYPNHFTVMEDGFWRVMPSKWERVSRILDTSSDPEVTDMLVRQVLGANIGGSFVSFRKGR